ncbi:hypothetical protein GCM10010873_24660 [Cypionkella aquatica]|uniref:Uncharacterized protein n=1 Tax=Cypionkella aquatica TaxID=1756042 RepID=A0AA37U096_9RHOB|nr:hypothetical protein [Cypionkella aquatica]GLS87492.1 hypothetical protein GCM10010873_24660 [Cypionkella aquatica]
MLRLSFLLMLLAAPVAAGTLSGVKAAEISGQLYAAGVAAGDPVLLIAAAKLRKSLVFRGEGEAPLGWEAMLAQAEAMAAGDDVLLGLIADVRAESSKGVASGPMYSIGTLASGGVNRFPDVGFAAGDYAEVYLEAKAETDLNLAVFDAKGQLVCADTDPGPIAYCGWTAARDAGYVMQVENLGPLESGYALMTN